MGLRSVGLLLPNAAGVLAIAGALYDRFVPSVPANHLAYLGADASGLDPRYAELDLAMLRSIGGCLMAVGVTALVLANGPVRRGEGWAGGRRGAGRGGRGEQHLPDVPVRLPLVRFARVRLLVVTGAVLAGPPRLPPADRAGD